MSLDNQKLAALVDRARREIDQGLLPSCQLAVGYEGEIVESLTLGDADDDTRFCIFSSSKPLLAAAAWALMGDGLLDVAKPVVEWIPEFGSNGKAEVTLEQVMLHTSGFPSAPMGPPLWSTREGRLENFARWRLEWQPGSAFDYHATSAHWVLAEVLERVSGSDFRDLVEQRVTSPCGLPRLLGIAHDAQANLAPVTSVGEAANADELEAAFGMRELPESEVTEEMVQAFNLPDIRELGVPGAGGFARATDLAMFYQALLHDPAGAWNPAVLEDARANVRQNMKGLSTGVPACRTLGLVRAGETDPHLRGFGRTVSARAFGHGGAGGQVAWADPDTGLSFAYLTGGHDRHQVRQPRRVTALSSLAAVLLAD